jgi:hypothetical protein
MLRLRRWVQKRRRRGKGNVRNDWWVSKIEIVGTRDESPCRKVGVFCCPHDTEEGLGAEFSDYTYVSILIWGK